jgi:hypothetical protein
MYNKIYCLILVMVFSISVYSQKVEVNIQNSENSCGLATNYSAGLVCFDIMMSVDKAKNLDSYNIWVSYDKTVISRVNGGADASCVISNGGDTDVENFASAFRVGGLPLAPYAMPAKKAVKVHTVCFQIVNFGVVGYSAYDGTKISVGGDKFDGALKSVVAFSDASFDDSIMERTLIVKRKGRSWDLSTFQQIQIESLELENNLLGFDVSNFVPNPSQGKSKLLITVKRDTQVEIQLFDGLGREINRRTASLVNGTNEVHFNVGDYESGVYTAVIKMNGEELFRKLIHTE